MRINEAQAKSIAMINEAAPGEAYLTLKKLEAMGRVADGQATKVIIPSELSSVVGLVNTIHEGK